MQSISSRKALADWWERQLTRCAETTAQAADEAPLVQGSDQPAQVVEREQALSYPLS